METIIGPSINWPRPARNQRTRLCHDQALLSGRLGRLPQGKTQRIARPPGRKRGARTPRCNLPTAALTCTGGQWLSAATTPRSVIANHGRMSVRRSRTRQSALPPPQTHRPSTIELGLWKSPSTRPTVAATRDIGSRAAAFIPEVRESRTFGAASSGYAKYPKTSRTSRRITLAAKCKTCSSSRKRLSPT